jgi:hypothetical protein
MLDDFHVQAAMWGNPGVGIPIDTAKGGPAEDQEPYFRLEDHGAFASPVKEGEKVVAWENRHPHVTAVVVVHERLHSDDWREEILTATALRTAPWMPPSTPTSRPSGR